MREVVDLLTMDDPLVREVITDMNRHITRRSMGALERSLKLRGLQEVWGRRITCKAGFTWEPPLGTPWETWFGVLADQGLEVRPVLRLLAEAGVLGPSWFEPAMDRVLREKGWR